MSTKKLNETGLSIVWQKVFNLIKLITGDVDVANKGDLQSQIDEIRENPASSVPVLETARAIDGVSFNGSSDITHYGTCSTDASTVDKVVSCSGFKLATGSNIKVKFTVTNTASSPTLNVNSTGAKPIYYRGSAISAGYLAANRTLEFVYNGTQYEVVGNLDSNTYDRLKYNSAIKCSTTAIVAGNLIVGNEGLYQHLKLGKVFDITYPILYAQSAISASGTGSNNYKVINMTVTTTQSIALTEYKPVYIKGKLNGTLFTPISTTPLTQEVPTTEDGYQYILIGLAYSSTGLYFDSNISIYEYKNGKFDLYDIPENSINALQDCEIVFNDDGSITETTPSYVLTTVFNNDDSITETYKFINGVTKTRTTTFNSDESISEVIN